MPISSEYVTSKIAALKAKFPHAGDFCFFTDIKNLRSIFDEKLLYSRNLAIAKGVLKFDCASAQVLNGTPAWVKDYFRCYFAPRTPMLYRVEGIKQQQDSWPECPIPVYFALHPDILTLPGVLISDGNMGAYATTQQEPTEEFFNSLPFDDIFHRGSTWLNPRQKEIMRCRHAEVLVPQKLPIRYASKIVFRSNAERDLAERLSSLPAEAGVEVDPRWFNAGRTFLDRIDGNQLIFTNSRTNDRVVTLTATESAPPKAREFVKVLSGWSAAKELPLDGLCLELPTPGKTFVFLNGHRVAILG